MRKVSQWIASIVFTAYLFVSVPFYAAVAFLAAAVPGLRPFPVARAWAKSVLALLRFLCGLDYRVEGAEHLRGSNGVALLKHSSAWETIAQFVVFPRQTWVMKRELLWVPILGWVLRLFRPIAINRKGGRSAVEQVVRLGQQRLAEGYWIMIFPEGTRVPVGEKRRYGISGALLATTAGCDVVPVAHNAGSFWPRRGVLKRRGLIRLAIGPRISTQGKDAREINAEVEAWIDAKLAEIGRRGVADGVD
jgi:1-acyl-sn-glycerol-3-phosphate acyltransferase